MGSAQSPQSLHTSYETELRGFYRHEHVQHVFVQDRNNLLSLLLSRPTQEVESQHSVAQRDGLVVTLDNDLGVYRLCYP